jgi:unsaturated chondroitin disaccharide hydrolase
MAVFICGFFDMQIDQNIKPADVADGIQRLTELSARKIWNLDRRWNPEQGTPVFTVDGKYTSRGWTEWTQGFVYGSALLQFDLAGDREFLEIGRKGTIERMASHVSHIGVHDHGFNNVSTYGNLRRLIIERRISEGDRDTCELALKVSGAVQAARWTEIEGGSGYIYSFNGPHSLFIDTMRSLRSLALAHQLGHALMAECDRKISLLDRLIEHGKATAKFAVYYGEGRDAYDVRGRTAHESIFNTNDGKYRCPNSQQGYSPFTTWSRGLAWAICGFAEQIEFLKTQPDVAQETIEIFRKAALATADLYIEESCADGIPMWDFGAPNLHRLGDYKSKPADPFNEWEPVDSSAAAIAAQGLIRIGEPKYVAAGLTIARNLFAAPYLSEDEEHEGLILHSIYHRPNGWDQIHAGQKVPNGESSMWGDYHARELALLIRRMHQGKYLNFYDAKTDARSNTQNAR